MKSSRESRKAAEEANLCSEVKLSGKRTGDRPRSGFCINKGQKDDDSFFIVFFCTGIIMTEYIIITNNPFVKEKLLNKRPVCYKPVDYEAILRYVKTLIEAGHQLLSHPLAGSVKPGETPLSLNHDFSKNLCRHGQGISPADHRRSGSRRQVQLHSCDRRRVRQRSSADRLDSDRERARFGRRLQIISPAVINCRF